MSSNLNYWIRIVLSAILLSITTGGSIGYYFIAIKGLYRNRENRWWVGVLAFGLPAITLISGLLLWVLWNPLVINIFWPLALLGLIISFLLNQSVTSPFKLADWWIEFGKWLQKRDSK